MSATLNNDRNPESLEREVDARRADLNQTLNAVEARLSPSHLVEQTMDYLGTHGGDIAGSVSRSVKDNPLPLLLTGVGLVWLMSSQSKAQAANHYRERMSSRYDDNGYYYDNRYGQRQPKSAYARTNAPVTDRQSVVYRSTRTHGQSGASDQMQGKVDEWSDNAEDWKDSLTTQLNSLKQEAQETAEQWRERVVNTTVEHSENLANSLRSANRQMSTQFHDQADSARNWMQEQPLVAGALGVAVGALLGSLLPSTSVENRLVGQSADGVKADIADKAKTVSASVASTVEEKSEQIREKGEQKLDDIAARSTDKATDKPTGAKQHTPRPASTV